MSISKLLQTNDFVQRNNAKLAVSKWEKTGLLEGLRTETEKAGMAQLLENQARQLVKEASSTGTTAGAALNPNRYFFAVAQSLPEDTSTGNYEIEASLTVFMSTLDEGNADGQIAEMLGTIKDSSMWSSLADSPAAPQAKPVRGEKVPKEKKEKKEKKAKKEKVDEVESSSSSDEIDPDNPWG